MTNDTVKTTEDFWTIIQSMIGKGGVARVASCSVSQITMRLDGEKQHHTYVIYKLALYGGSFCVWKARRKFSRRCPVYMCKRDVIQFISKSLSHQNSPYFFNPNSGKWDHIMILGV